MRLLDWFVMIGGFAWIGCLTWYFKPWIQAFRDKGIVVASHHRLDAYQVTQELEMYELKRRGRL